MFIIWRTLFFERLKLFRQFLMENFGDLVMSVIVFWASFGHEALICSIIPDKDTQRRNMSVAMLGSSVMNFIKLRVVMSSCCMANINPSVFGNTSLALCHICVWLLYLCQFDASVGDIWRVNFQLPILLIWFSGQLQVMHSQLLLLLRCLLS